MFREFDEKDTRYKCVIRTRTKAETPGLIAIKSAWTDATDADRAAFDEWRAGAGR